MIATCIFLDIDECLLSGCLKNCKNFPGSYRCGVCNKGFRPNEYEKCIGMIYYLDADTKTRLIILL